ncbi:MAG: hypothetical protein RRY55_01160 [Bacteroidales bacterium]
MEKQAEKPQRGGKRTGAGRKSKYGATVNINFRLDADLQAFIKGSDNRSRFINEAIREKKQRDIEAL